MAAARRWRRKCRTRDAVLALLLVSVLAPLALYSGAPISAFSGPALTGSAFGRDPSNLIARNEAGKRLSSLRQDAFGAVKDPVRTVALDASVKREGTAVAGIQQVVTGSSMYISGESGGSKDGRARSIDDTKQASYDSSKRKRVDDGLSSLDEGVQYREQSGLSNVGAARDNKVRGMHNAGYRNVPLDKVMDCLVFSVHEKIRAMESILTKIKQVHDNCAAAIDKLQTDLHSTENQLEARKHEANYVAQIAAKALPKRLHCLALRLTNEYYSSSSNIKHFPYQEKLEDAKLHHYALFSDNVLAAAVVVNSTLVHAKKPANHVFHIVTDKLNYAAMRIWFLVNPPDKAAIQVQKIEEFTWLNSSYSPVLKQLESHFMINYYFNTPQNKPDKNPKFRNPKYLSILNHLRFYLPEIFPRLNKVLFLDDDIVVQQDLSPLWSIDLKGKVNGAVQTCGEVFHRFDRYLNFSNPLIAKKFDRRACDWAYGMNMFDLSEWRKQNITNVYHYWQEQNEHRLLWKLGTLPAGLVTFWNRTFPLDRSWHLLGLGYKPNLNPQDIEQAAVVHYNGNLKPWLEVGLPKYRKYWSKYVKFDQAFIRECNIHP
ncbi:hypothetical protein ACQ4PT_013017 [Festuca glaucescens]